MAPPYDDLLGLSADPFRALLAHGYGRRPPAVPDLPPQEQDALLGGLMETSLGGLAYLGKVLDKTFGGRAVRGALGGRPGELLSVLPFSDTLGVTDERDAVQGTDLLANAGLVTPGDDSWPNMLAGFAAETLLDPATYVGLGPLTRAGALAKKAGALPRGLAAGMRGFDVAESAVAPTLRAGERAKDALGVGETMLPAALEARGVATGEPLRALVGLGLPFGDPLVTLGTGPAAQKVARGLDAAGSAAAGSAPVRALRAALDPEAGGAFTRGGQQLAADTLRPESRGLARDATERYVGLLQQAHPYLDTPERQRRAADVIRMAAEGFGGDALARATAGPDFAAREGLDLVRIGKDLGDSVREYAKLEQDLGLNTRELTDAFAEYLTRTKNPLPTKAGESVWSAFKRRLQEFSTTHGSQIGRDEMFQNVPGGTVRINDWAKDAGLRQMTDLQRQDFFRTELTGVSSPPKGSPAWEQAARLSRWVESLPAEHVTQQLDFFRADPFADFLLRGQRSAKARAGAETIFEGIKRFAAPRAEFAARGEDAVPVEEVFKQLALDKPPAPGGNYRAHEIAARRLGLQNLNDLKGYALPADVARDMVRLGRAWENPRELTPLLGAWDWASNLFKTWVTAPFAAFHARNVMSGVFNMWRDGVQPAAMVPAMREAYTVLRGGELSAPLPQLAGATAREQTDALVRAAVADRVAFTREAGRAADTAPGATAALVQRAPAPGGTGNSLLGDILEAAKKAIPRSWEQANPLNVEGVNRLTDANSFIAQMRKVQGTLDDWLQLSHYIAKLRQGWDPAAAGLQVKRYHNDYTELTNTERNVLKRVMPWYSFSRRSLPPLLEDALTKPAKVAAALRATSGVRTPFEFVPSYVAEGASVPVPGAPDGQRRYASSFGLPVEDEAVKALGSLAQGDLTRSLQQVLGMAQPAIKAPLERAFGTQLYSGRRLEDLRALNLVQGTGLLNEENARLASQAIANSPASRFFTSLDKLLDERKGAAPTLLNLLTGVRVTDVDSERSRDVAAKRLLEEKLRGKPGVRVAESVYVPAEKLGLLDPLEYQLYQSYRTADKAVQKRNRERRERGPAAVSQ